jgi:hypothetical protein
MSFKYIEIKEIVIEHFTSFNKLVIYFKLIDIYFSFKVTKDNI